MGRFPKRRVGSAARRFGAVRVASALILAAASEAAVAQPAQVTTDRASTRAEEARRPEIRDDSSGAPTPAAFDSGAAVLGALDSWNLVACDPSTGAAVVRSVAGPLRVVRRGDRIETLEVAELRSDRLLLRPVPGSSGHDNVLAVWLSRAGNRDEPRVRVVRYRDESGPHPRVVPSRSAGSALPEGARVVRSEAEGEVPR